MKRIKLVANFCCLTALSAGAALCATSCNSNNVKSDIKITANNNTTWDNDLNTLNVINTGSAADALISLSGWTRVSFKLDPEVEGLDIVDGSATNIKDKLTIDPSFRTDRIGKEITIKQRDGDAVMKINVAAVVKINVGVDTSAMMSEQAIITNQCYYNDATDEITVNKNASFGSEEDPRYISVPLKLKEEAESLNPETDFVAFLGPKQINGVKFEWTLPGGINDYKSITLKLPGSVYKSLEIWSSKKITVKNSDSSRGALIEPITFNMTKDYYVIDSANPGGDSWSNGQGGYIRASLNPENKLCGTWLGLDQNNTAKTLKISIPNEISWLLTTIESWSGKVGLDDAEGIEVVANGSQPTKTNKAYIQLPAVGVSSHTVYFVIPTLEAFPTNDVIYINAEDDVGHNVAITFKVEHITGRSVLHNGEDSINIIDGQSIDSKHIHDIGGYVNGNVNVFATNDIQPALWKMYVFTENTLSSITLNEDKSSYYYYNGDGFLIGIEPNIVTANVSAQMIIYGYDENDNIIVKHTYIYAR